MLGLAFTAQREIDIVESPLLIAGIAAGVAALCAVIYGLSGAITVAALLSVIVLLVDGNHSESAKLAFVLVPLMCWISIACVFIRRFLTGWQKRRLVGVGDELQRLRVRLDQLESLNAAGGVAEILGEASASWMRDVKEVCTSGSRILAKLSPAQRESDEAQKFEFCLRSINEGLAAQEMLAGGLKLDVQKEVKLGDIVHEAVKEVQEHYDRLSLTLEVDIEDGGVPCAVDPELMKKAVINMLTNAAEASGHGSKVTISASSDFRGDRGVIEIVDKGSGINSDVIPYIFKPYFTTRHNRLGLGLSVAREIVSRMGGSIAVVSNETRGMTFRVRLPMRRAELQSGTASRAETRKEDAPHIPTPQDKILGHIERLQKADS